MVKSAIYKKALAVVLGTMLLGVVAQAQRDDHDRGRGRDKKEDRGNRHDQGRHLGQIRHEDRDHYRGDDRRDVVREMPRGYRHVDVRGRSYYYNEGRFYEPRDRGYVMVAPPIGAAVINLPGTRIAFSFGGMRYYACGDGFYREDRPGYYTVVEPPYGAVVNVLPSGYRVVRDRGVTFYVVGGVRYRQEFRHRRRVFVVVR